MSLSNKLKEGKLKILTDFKINKPKTSELKSKLEKLKIESALFIDGMELEKNFEFAIRNVPKTDVLLAAGINVYDIVKRDFLILSERGLETIMERFNK